MAVKKTIELEAKVDKAQKDLDGVAKSVQRIDNNLEEVKETSGGVAKGVKGIGNALKAAGIGLAVAAFAKLAEVFNQNQKVADAFNTTFEVLSIAFNDFFKFLNNNVGTVIDYFKGIFDDPVQSIKNFASSIKQGIIDRLKQGLEALGLFGKAAIKFFAGDFAGAAMTAKEASKELFDIVTGEDGGFEKITESVKTTVASITDYAKSTVQAAKETVELNKAAEVAAVINQGLIEKYDRQAEQQRQLRDDETKTIEERIAANNRLGEILDEQAEKMLENVDITIKAAQAEYDKNQNQENYIALLEAQNEREAVLAQIEGFRSEQIINRISLEKEAGEQKIELLEKEIELEERKREAIYGAMDAVAEAAGEESKIAKALFILKTGMIIKEQVLAAQATMQRILASAAESGVDGAKGLMKAASAAPPPANVPLIAIFAAQAAGIAMSIKSAVGAAKSMIGSAGGASGSMSGGGVTSAPQAPAFNVVGAAPENQLAQVIGEQEQKPVKAFVVSSEVSNQQALDRKVETGAAIG
jgi:hypothetical protein